MQPQDDSSPTRSNQDKKQKKEKEKPNTVRKDEQGEIADESEADEITTLSLFSHLRVSPTSTLSISADQLLRCIFPFPLFPDTDYYKWKNTTRKVREACLPLILIRKL